MFKSECLMDMYHNKHGMHVMHAHTLIMWSVQLCMAIQICVPSLVHSNCVHGLLAPPWGMGCTSHCDGSALTTALTG